MSTWNLPWHGFLCTLSPDPRQKRSAYPSPLPLFMKLYRSVRPPLSLLPSKPRVLRCSSQDKPYSLCFGWPVMLCLMSDLVLLSESFWFRRLSGWMYMIPLHKSMLNISSHLLGFHTHRHYFQDYVLHRVSKVWGEAESPLVPWVLHPALSEERNDTFSFPVPSNLSHLPHPLKGN